MLLLPRPTAGVQGPGELWWGTCHGAGCGSPPGSPRPAGGQQHCLVLECVELCLEEGGCITESCPGDCVREKHVVVYLCVRCVCVCVCVHTGIADPLQRAHVCVLGGKGSRDCAEFEENQFNSGLF